MEDNITEKAIKNFQDSANKLLLQQQQTLNFRKDPAGDPLNSESARG